MHFGGTGKFCLKLRKPYRNLMPSPAFLSIMHIYFVQVAPPVTRLNYQFRFAVVGVWELRRAWELGLEQTETRIRTRLVSSCSVPPYWQGTSTSSLFTTVKSSLKSSGWRLQNELRWLSIPPTFPVKTHRIFLWITFTTLMVIWIFFPPHGEGSFSDSFCSPT